MLPDPTLVDLRLKRPPEVALAQDDEPRFEAGAQCIIGRCDECEEVLVRRERRDAADQSNVLFEPQLLAQNGSRWTLLEAIQVDSRMHRGQDTRIADGRRHDFPNGVRNAEDAPDARMVVLVARRPARHREIDSPAHDDRRSIAEQCSGQDGERMPVRVVRMHEIDLLRLANALDRGGESWVDRGAAPRRDMIEVVLPAPRFHLGAPRAYDDLLLTGLVQLAAQVRQLLLTATPGGRRGNVQDAEWRVVVDCFGPPDCADFAFTARPARGLRRGAA